MADRYWMGGAVGGNNWSDPDNWASMSGGAGGAGVPTIDDDVYFDDGSGPPPSTDCTIDIANPVCNAFYGGIASQYYGSITGLPSTILVRSGTVQLGPTWPGGITNVYFMPLAPGLVQVQGIVVSFVPPNALPNISAFAAKPGSGVPAGYVGAIQLGDSFVFEGQVKLPLPSTDNHVQLYVNDSLGIAPPIVVAEIDDFDFAIDTWYSLDAIFDSTPEWTPAATGRFFAQLHIDDNTNATIADAVDGCNVTDFPAEAEVEAGVFFNYGAAEGDLVAPPAAAILGAFSCLDGSGNIIIRGSVGVPVIVSGAFQFEADVPGALVSVIAQDISDPLAPIPLPDLMPAAPYAFVAGVTRSLDDLNGGPLTFTPPYDGDFALGCFVQNPAAAYPIMTFTEITTLAAGGPTGGAVQNLSAMDPTETFAIMRGSAGASYPVGGTVTFDADTLGVAIQLSAINVTNPAAPVPLADLIPLGLFDFVAGVPRTMDDLAGAPLAFVPPTDGDFVMALTVAPPAGTADDVLAYFTTQPVGPTPPPPPPMPIGAAIDCTRDYPDNLSQGFNSFPLNPVMLHRVSMVGDWGLVVNQPAYPKNGFYCNSVSGLPAQGQTIEFRAAVAAGEYSFRLWAPKNNDCGIVDVQLNGFSVALNQDLYAAALDINSVISVPRVKLPAGLQRIKFTVSGKNPLSSNFFFRIIGIELAPWQPGTV